MTIDRTALRRLWLTGSWKVSGHAGTILDAVPDLIDELDAKDRRIAELEGQLAGLEAGLREALQHYFLLFATWTDDARSGHEIIHRRLRKLVSSEET